jgi:hypothetical protein
MGISDFHLIIISFTPLQVQSNLLDISPSDNRQLKNSSGEIFRHTRERKHENVVII